MPRPWGKGASVQAFACLWLTPESQGHAKGVQKIQSGTKDAGCGHVDRSDKHCRGDRTTPATVRDGMTGGRGGGLFDVNARPAVDHDAFHAGVADHPQPVDAVRVQRVAAAGLTVPFDRQVDDRGSDRQA